MCEIQEESGIPEPTETYGETPGTVSWKSTELPDGVSPGFVFTATRSDSCPRATKSYDVSIFLVCDPNAATPYTEMIDDDYWECQVHAKLYSALACKLGNPSGGQATFTEEDETDVGMILCILFFLGFGFYFAGGIAYNIKYKGMDKYEAVPHKEFWMSLPGLVKAGCEFTKVKAQELYQKIQERRSGSYQQL